MDLSTKYMGIDIKNPLVVSSSGLTNTIDKIKELEDKGAAAVVLKSLFEEQLMADHDRLHEQDDMYFWYPEAMDYVDTFTKEDGVENYLQLIGKAKDSVDIPVIASINCITPLEWPVFSKEIAKAGADGLELNIYIPPAEIDMTPGRIEDTYIEIIREVQKNVNLPIGVKVGHFFTNLMQALLKLSNTEIQSLILFNRYYRPDIDIQKMQVITGNIYSSPEEITLSLRWIALLSEKIKSELVAATGIHDYSGVIKQLLAGATAVQLCSALYRNGTGHLSVILEGIEKWMTEHKYENISRFKGKLARADENRPAFERLQFMQKTTGKL